MLQTHICVQMSHTLKSVKAFQDGAFMGERKSDDVDINVEGGGTLVFGQEQDSLNGGFHPDQAFRYL